MPRDCQRDTDGYRPRAAYPKVILALQINLRASRDSGTLISPGSSDSQCRVNNDLATCDALVVIAVSGSVDNGPVEKR